VLSIRQAAERLGVSVSTVRAWADDGRLPSERTPGNHRRFSEADVERLLSGEVVRRSASIAEFRAGAGAGSDAGADAGPEQSRRSSVRRVARSYLEARAVAVPPWEARVKHAQADVAVLKAHHELRALTRAERDEEVASEREAAARRDELERESQDAIALQERREQEAADLVVKRRRDSQRRDDLVERGSSRAFHASHGAGGSAYWEARERLQAEVKPEWTESQVDELVDEVFDGYRDEVPASTRSEQIRDLVGTVRDAFELD